jgi:hypothetical protein
MRSGPGNRTGAISLPSRIRGVAVSGRLSVISGEDTLRDPRFTKSRDSRHF